MKILFDTCVPRPLQQCLAAHQVIRAQQQGWGELRNGDLLNAAESADFELFVTADKNLRYQQQLSGRRIAVLVLPSNSWPILLDMTSVISDAVDKMKPGDFREILM